MTYDPTDIANGTIRHSAPTDPSPIGRLTRLLDGVTDDLLAGKGGDLLRGEARGLATALSILTCYDEDEVRAQVMLRRDDRLAAVRSPAPRPRRKRQPSS